MGEKWFPLAKKSVSTSRNNVIFQKLDFPVSISRKKSLIKKDTVSRDTKSVSISANGEFEQDGIWEWRILLDRKTASFDRNIWKIKQSGCQ